MVGSIIVCSIILILSISSCWKDAHFSKVLISVATSYSIRFIAAAFDFDGPAVDVDAAVVMLSSVGLLASDNLFYVPCGYGSCSDKQSQTCKKHSRQSRHSSRFFAEDLLRDGFFLDVVRVVVK